MSNSDDLIARHKAEGTPLRRKSLPVSTQVDPESRTAVHRITSWALDRDDELVDPAGIVLDHYRDNPAVLFNHEVESPVGKALWIKPDGNGLVMKSKYPARPADLHPATPFKPDEVFALMSCDPPVLTGASIGFIPLEIRDPTPEERQQFPGVRQVISKSLLTEVSMVAVPCNPEALLVAVTKGLVKFKKVGHVRRKAPARKYLTDPDAVARMVADRYMGRI